MQRHGEHGSIAGVVLLALIAAAVLGTGLLVAADHSVDRAAVTAPPGTETMGTGTTGIPGTTGTGPPVGSGSGDDTATTSPEPPPGDRGAEASSPDPAPTVGTPGAAARPPGRDGASAAAGPASPAGLPYGTAAAERTGTASAPGELARTGPAVPSSLAVLLVAAGLLVALLARAGAPRED